MPAMLTTITGGQMNVFKQVFNDESPEVRTKVISIYALLVGFNIVIWLITLFAASQFSTLLATGFLAYTLGLRHAVDADHIAAIDNVTRKLMQEGKRPVATGLFFSLGHSSVVILASLLLAFAARAFQQNEETFKSVGGLIGPAVSAFFLFAIGIINLLVLLDLIKMFRRVTREGVYSEEKLDEFLANRGLMNRFFRPMVRAIDKSWKMYPLGFLFGLGFDTASEVALLGISATAAGAGMPIGYVLLLPLLFTAGMTLVDTTDGVLMLGAYGWAFVKPIRKLFYNITITAISVAVALVVGSIEVLGIMADRLNLTGGAWDWLGALDFEVIGYAIIAILLAGWLVSYVTYKVKRYDELPVKVEM